MINKFEKSPVIPVLTFDNIKESLEISEILVSEGLTNLEITLRTPNSMACIEAIAKEFPSANVGAGTIVDDLAYTEFQGYLELPTADYTLQINTADGSTGVVAYAAPLATLALDGAALVAIASGFLDPSQNSDGPAFGVYVALPAGGELVALPSATLGVEDFDTNTFLMYPNPAVSELNFEYPTLESNALNITITDMQGRTVATDTINASNQSMDVTNLSSGLYQVLIMEGNDLVGTKKLLKK